MFEHFSSSLCRLFTCFHFRRHTPSKHMWRIESHTLFPTQTSLTTKGGHIFITNSINKMAKEVQVHFQNWDLVGLGAWARSMCQPHWPHKDTLEDWPLTRTHPPQDLPQRAHLRLWLGRFGAAADATASSPPHKTSRRPAHTPHFKSVLCNSEILNRRSTRFVVLAPFTHKVF